MRALKATFREPIVIAALLCYLAVIWAMITHSNAAQDATRQRQIDAAEAGIERHVTREANRIIGVLGNRGN